MMRTAALLAACLMLASCGHKGALLSPSQIAEKERKKEASAAKKAARDQQKTGVAAPAAPAPAPASAEDSQEVTVP